MKLVYWKKSQASGSSVKPGTTMAQLDDLVTSAQKVIPEAERRAVVQNANFAGISPHETKRLTDLTHKAALIAQEAIIDLMDQAACRHENYEPLPTTEDPDDLDIIYTSTDDENVTTVVYRCVDCGHMWVETLTSERAPLWLR